MAQTQSNADQQLILRNITVETEEARLRASDARLMRLIVRASYVTLALQIIFSVLFALIPYYLSGYDALSYEHIELSNLWLWEYDAYPLYAWGGSIFVGFVVGWPCVSLPALPIATLELIVRWRRTPLSKNAIQLGAILLAIATIVALVMVDKLSILITD